jgi:carbonic anhydrase/acetyltransferase-like protein (isoleucine patch superfamily)
MRDVSEAAFVHPSAVIVGDVVIGAGSSVWPGAVIMGDCNQVTIGRFTNIQENAIIHVAYTPTVIGDYVCIAHGAVAHACTVEDEVMVGVNATILDGATIGRGSVIGAGALVRENAIVPPNSLVVGVPGEIKEGRGGALLTRGTALYYHEVALRFAQGEETFKLDEVMARVQDRMASEQEA